MFLTASATALTATAITATSTVATTAPATPASPAYLFPVLEAVAVIALVLWRQLTPRQVKSDLVKLPLILGIVGLGQLWPYLAGGVRPLDAVTLVVSLACGAVIAVPRARSLLLWQAEDGAWMRRGTLVTLAWWIASFALHALVHAAPAVLGLGQVGEFGSASMLVYLGVVLGVQGLCLERRLEALAPGTRRWAGRAAASN